MKLKSKLSFFVIIFSWLALSFSANASMQTHKEKISVSFPDSSTTFRPNALLSERLRHAPNAAVIYINGRTSTNNPSARDEVLALKRALSARKYFVERYNISPMKIMVNFISAADYATENVTPKGRLTNQRVDIVMYFILPGQN